MSLKKPTKIVPNKTKSLSKFTKKRKKTVCQATFESDDSDDDYPIKRKIKTRSQVVHEADSFDVDSMAAQALTEFEQRWGISSFNDTDSSSNNNPTASSDLVPVGRLFTITAGSGHYKRTFTVELETFGALSDVLYKHTHNEMKEGLEGTMVLEEFYPETLMRLFAWGKVGYYPSSERMDIPRDHVKRLKRPGTVIKRQTYYALRESIPTEEVEKLFKIKTNDTAIIHERVYILADRFNISALKAYSLRKICGLHSKSITYVNLLSKPTPRRHKCNSEKVKISESKAKAKDSSDMMDEPSERHQKILTEIISMVQLGYDYLCPAPIVPLNPKKGELTNIVPRTVDVFQRLLDMEATATITSPLSATSQKQQKLLPRTEPLLAHLSKVASWHLHYLRAEQDFVSLLKNYPDFAASVVMVPQLVIRKEPKRIKLKIRKPPIA